MPKLKVDEITPVTDRIRLFRLISSHGAALAPYTAGAHLDFDLKDLGHRSYSLVDFEPSSGAPTAYHIAVQREPDGTGGSVAMHTLVVGDILDANAPKNDFELHDGAAPMVFIAGGIGVTPIISFATEAQRRGTPFHFHYATRDEAHSAFGDRLKAQHGDKLSLWFDDKTPIDLKGIISGADKAAHIYCCGPKGMIEAVRELAEGAGFPKEHIHFELFATPASHEGDTAFEVEIKSTGQVVVVPADKTIIEALEDAGVDVMYDCQRGDCGICQTDVISGTPDHRDVVLSEAERASGKVMQICVSRAKSDRLVLDI